MSFKIDLAKISLLFHIYTYSLSRALTKTLGKAQVVLINDFAKTFLNLCSVANLKFKDINSYILSLRDIGILEQCRLNRLSKHEVEFIIEKCVLAQLIHKPLNMIGYTGDICPLAMMGMVVLSIERGWKPENNLFSFVKFSGKLTYFTSDGSRTVFQIVKS